ncbi:MAG TPA: hypothetical protein VFV50_06525, partial [Bdellovibrionales bacterium]|nr:hypothetical protein [Bdellovibrionales bacterium]
MKAYTLVLLAGLSGFAASAGEIPVAKIAQLKARLNTALTLSEREVAPGNGDATYSGYFQKGAQVTKAALDNKLPY